MTFRILDDDLSDTVSINSLDTSAVTADSSEASAEQAASNIASDEEMEHTVDPC